MAEEEGIQIQPAKQEEDSLWSHLSWNKFIPDALGPVGWVLFHPLLHRPRKRIRNKLTESKCPSDGFIVTCTHAQYSRDCPGFAKDLSKFKGFYPSLLSVGEGSSRQSRMVALSLSLACGGPSWGGKAASESAWDLFRPSPISSSPVFLSDALNRYHDFPPRWYHSSGRTLKLSCISAYSRNLGQSWKGEVGPKSL